MAETRRRDTVVVTGASAGVGRATARAFGARGARVALLARGLDGLEGARREVEEAGGEALILPTDVSDADAVERAAEQTEKHIGPIDVWVNAAMATVFGEFQDITPEEYRRATEVTYLGFVYGTLSAYRRMRSRNHGSIVQVGSALSYRAVPLQSAYCGAKHAIRGFTDSLRSEIIHNRLDVHLTMVQLSAFNTPQFDWSRTHTSRKPQPLPPIFQPEVAADGIVWAAYHRRREVYLGFPAVKAIVANKIAPRLLDHVLASQGYSGQITDRPIEPDRPDNLFEPAAGDFDTRGSFSKQAKTHSWQLWANKNKLPLMLGAGALALLGAAALRGNGGRVRRALPGSA